MIVPYTSLQSSCSKKDYRTKQIIAYLGNRCEAWGSSARRSELSPLAPFFIVKAGRRRFGALIIASRLSSGIAKIVLWYDRVWTRSHVSSRGVNHLR
jgi:hypothetical protein